ncbi:MAG: recombinase family protein [Sphaerospermopsis sp. SIO1G1]|nr:recombinase family protein [Sphaerospermopsis sp. SIO1G1]
MISDSIWIVGASRSGKTTYLAQKFCEFVEINKNNLTSFQYDNKNGQETKNYLKNSHNLADEARVIVLAANEDNRRSLSNQIATLTGGKYPFRVKTFLGFIQDEVILFWPLLVEILNIKAQFPVRLRPETEQELATKLWENDLDEAILLGANPKKYRLVRKILDIFQLAAYSGVPCIEISEILARGLQPEINNLDPKLIKKLLLNWHRWCLDRGFISYGLITELYHQYLLTNSQYQQKLKQRYQIIIADDVDNYPAIAYDLFNFLLDGGAVGAFSYNLHGSVRWGLGADPQHLAKLKNRCRVENFSRRQVQNLADELSQPIVDLITAPMVISSLPKTLKLTLLADDNQMLRSRSQLLRKTTEVIIDGIKSEQIQPEEIAIIAPGLDAIARYTISEILKKQNILVESLNEQYPLISSPAVRSLLTLLTLIYPGLGRLLTRDQISEMLVVLSQNQNSSENQIDPVRAGLIADHCFVPHPDYPYLADVKTFERWDRIGYSATTAYHRILAWIEKQKLEIKNDSLTTPINTIYQASHDFLFNSSPSSFQTLSSLRELLETAQHYWEISTRLNIKKNTSETSTISKFIQLLRLGTITANPYPIHHHGHTRKAVTLATIFQYRASHRNHKWHFWLDAGSPLWAKGGAASLFSANLFLRDRLGKPWTVEDEKKAEMQRLERIIVDLLSRVSEKVYLCHSELAVNGQEQIGPLSPLISACEQ